MTDDNDDERNQEGVISSSLTNSDETIKGSCCHNDSCSCRHRFTNEFFIGAFAVEEKPFGKLDMERNFRMGKGIFSFLGGIKLGFLGLTMASLVVDIVSFEYRNYWMAYLTNWSLIYCIVYQIGSLLLTVLKVPTSYNDPNNKQPFLLKLTWISFSLAAVHQVCIFFLFWGTVYYPGYDLTFSNVMLHGGVMILILFDGLVMNRTPVRLKHLVLNMIMAILYAVWSILQNTVCRCNPYTEGEDKDDDAIYDVMKWREEPGLAIGAFLILLLVVLPLFQILCWAVSLPGRYYLSSSSPKNAAEVVVVADAAADDTPKWWLSPMLLPMVWMMCKVCFCRQ